MLDSYIDNLYEKQIGILNKKKNKHNEIFMATIITSLDRDLIFPSCVEEFS